MPTPFGVRAACVDVSVPGSYTCAQQRDFGKCGADFMVGFCDVSCGRCTTTSQDSAGVGGLHTLYAVPCFVVLTVQQATLRAWLLLHSHNLPVPEAACVDVAPNGTNYTCAQQKSFGKCNAAFMAGYCKVTCGRCATAAVAAPKASPNRELR